MFLAEFSEYAKFDNNLLQTHENITPQNWQFFTKKHAKRDELYNKLWLGNVRKIPGKKTTHGIAGKISGEFHWQVFFGM